MARNEAELSAWEDGRFCNVAAAILGSAAIGAIGSSSSGGSDTSGQERVAQNQLDLSKEELAWKKQLYADSAGERAAASGRAQQMSDAQVRMMDTQMNLANEYADYNRTTFRPLEQKMVAEAEAYDTPERREAAATAAKADVETNLAAQRGISSRNLSRMGVNPSSGKALAMNNEMAIAGASLQAGASNRARTQVETMGQARKMDAVSLGRNLPANQAAAAGLAVTAANGAAHNAQLPVANTAAGAELMSSGYAGARAGLAGAGQTFGNIASIQTKQASDDAAMWSSLGSAAMKYGMGKGYI